MQAEYILEDAEKGHKLLSEIWQLLKPYLLSKKKYLITIEPYEFTLIKKQRAYYHRYVLKEIKARLLELGHDVALKSLKEHYRCKFLGIDGQELVLEVVNGEDTYKEVRASTENLTYKGYSTLIERVTADAAINYGVIFSEDINTWKPNDDDD